MHQQRSHPSARDSVSSQTWLSHVIARQRTSRIPLTLTNGATIQVSQHEDWEIDDVPPCEDHLLVFRRSGTAQVERRIEGRLEIATCRPGGITTVPAHHSTSWRIRGLGTAMHLHLPQDLIHGVVGQALCTRHECAVAAQLGNTDDRLAQLFRRLAQETELCQFGHQLYAETLITQIVIHVLRADAFDLARMPGRKLSQRHARAVLAFITDNLSTAISLTDLAAITGLGLSQFSSNFRATFGVSAYEYVLRQRVEFARQLLHRPDLGLAEIALESGFAHQAHLTKTFKRICGETPSSYRSCI